MEKLWSSKNRVAHIVKDSEETEFEESATFWCGRELDGTYQPSDPDDGVCKSCERSQKREEG